MIKIDKIIIIGGGAAGLMAAVSAAEHGGNVLLLEKMPAIGKKLLITGKGRCNITNNCTIEELIENIPGNGSFLYSAFNNFDNKDLLDFFHKLGLKTKVERGGRVFPESDKAKDVVAAFEKALKSLKIEIALEEAAAEIVLNENSVCGVKTCRKNFHKGQAVILAAGGATYPLTGSNGDGCRLAEKAGHHIIPLKPALAPLEVAEDWVRELQGLSLKNVTATVLAKTKNEEKPKKIKEDFGEMLFTHYGLSGPIILSLSRTAVETLKKGREVTEVTEVPEVTIAINLKPALTIETLDKRLQRDFEKFSRKQLKNSLNELLPSKLIDVIIDLAFLDSEKPVNQITKEERHRLLHTLQNLTFTVTGPRPLSEAIVTAGGVSTKEINSSTMQSKIIKGLYFAGEVIDIDGYTGGFNLQAAFSTGYLAGKHAAINNLEN